MDPLIISGGIAAGSALMNSIIGSSSSSNLNAKNRAFQREMSDTAYKRQRELIVDQYQLQKNGMMLAGISPAAMQGYSGGTASLSSYPASPSSIPEYVPFDVSSVLGAIKVSNDTKIADSVAEKNYADAEKTKKEAGRYDELTDATLKQINSNVGLNQAEVSKINASIPLLDNQSAYYNYLAENEEVRWQAAQATKQSEIDRIKAQNHLDESEAKKKLSMINDIIDAQYNLTLAQIYNAKASGQAQLSNAYTNRLQYQLDKSLNSYLQTYYKDSAEKLKQESISEDSLRQARLKLLDNDADYSHAKKVYQDNLNRTYNVDNTVNNVSKVVGTLSGAASSAAKVAGAIP